jgi:hypothetical protein
LHLIDLQLIHIILVLQLLDVAGQPLNSSVITFRSDLLLPLQQALFLKLFVFEHKLQPIDLVIFEDDLLGHNFDHLLKQLGFASQLFLWSLEGF